MKNLQIIGIDRESTPLGKWYQPRTPSGDAATGMIGVRPPAGSVCRDRFLSGSGRFARLPAIVSNAFGVGKLVGNGQIYAPGFPVPELPRMLLAARLSAIRLLRDLLVNGSGSMALGQWLAAVYLERKTG